MKNSIKPTKDNAFLIRNPNSLITLSLCIWSIVLFGCGLAVNWNGNAGFAIVFVAIGIIIQIYLLQSFFKHQDTADK